MEKRRVVITGLGMITPLGQSVDENWQRILAGESGINRITLFDPGEYKSQIAGEVKKFNPEEFLANLVPKKEIKKMDRFIQFGLFAANQTIQDAKLNLEILNRNRIGVCLGVGYIGINFLSEEINKLKERGPERVSPFLIPATISNLAPGQISIVFGLKGPNLSITTACAAGSHAIGESLMIIQENKADVMLAGGAEAPIAPISVAGFGNMRALSTKWNDNPKKASRPFDKERDGFCIAEGAGILVLEELQHALNRGAKIYGELIGFGMNSDAHHITEPTVEGPMECIRLALEDTGVKPEEVGYINAHGTSTPTGDLNETKAIKELFGEYAYRIPVSSTKSMTGHLLGAAGGVEAIYTVLALKDGVIPPTINLENFDPECDLDYVPNKARKAEIKVALSNSFGFGGTNACLVFKQFEEVTTK